MFKCPVCGAVAKTRTSRSLSNTTVRHYHQCQNFECSITFTTLNSVEKLVTKRTIAKSCHQALSPPMHSPHRITATISLVLPYEKAPPMRGFVIRLFCGGLLPHQAYQ